MFKEAGRLTAHGRVVAYSLALVGVFVAQSAVVRLHLWAGASAVQSDNVDDAIGHFEQAAHWGLVRPSGLRRTLAALYQQSGNTIGARNELNALVAGDPNDRGSRVHLARVWMQEGRYELARRQAAAALDPEITDADQPGVSPQQRRVQASALCVLADIDARAGESALAVDRFESAVRISPRHLEALLGLGAMRAAQGETDAAIEHLERAVAVSPDSASAHNNLATVLMRAGRRDQALEHFRRTLDLSPGNPLAHCNVGELLFELGSRR